MNFKRANFTLGNDHYSFTGNQNVRNPEQLSQRQMSCKNLKPEPQQLPKPIFTATTKHSNSTNFRIAHTIQSIPNHFLSQNHKVMQQIHGGGQTLQSKIMEKQN